MHNMQDKAVWTHVTIKVRDLDLSLRFYRDVCGLAVLRDRRLERGTTVWMGYAPGAGKLPAFVLVLEPTPGDAVTAGATEYGHLGFQCIDRAGVDEIAALGRAEGLLVSEPKDSGGAVGYWTMIRDPDGYTVEFTHGQPLAGLQ